MIIWPQCYCVSSPLLGDTKCVRNSNFWYQKTELLISEIRISDINNYLLIWAIELQISEIRIRDIKKSN